MQQLKSGPIARVKADRESKKMWNDIRRKITPRVGQLTNEAQVIMNIVSHLIQRCITTTPDRDGQSQQIVQLLRPSNALPPDVYHASLSSLAKAILLQAETEVTAEKRSAKPLAQLTLNSIIALDGFSTVFWAKLCQRTGGWAVPAPVPSKDADGMPFTSSTRMKASGLREETSADYVARVAGIMRVYFSLLLLPPSSPLPREFHTPRLWMFIARLVGQPALLQSALAMELLSGMSYTSCYLLSRFAITEFDIYFTRLLLRPNKQSLWTSVVRTHATCGARSGSSSWPCCMRASRQTHLLSVARDLTRVRPV
jgi:nucleoporin GLE1